MTCIGWLIFIVACIKGILSLSVEILVISVGLAGNIHVYSLKHCDLIMLVSPQTKIQTFISTIPPIIMIVYFLLLLFSFPSNIVLMLFSVYWFSLGFLMIIFIDHHESNLKKKHPLFFYTTLSTGYYLVGISFYLIVWQYTEILLIPNLQKMMEIGNIKSIVMPLVLILFLFSISYIGSSFIWKTFRISEYLNKLAKSLKKNERKLFIKLIKDSWAHKVDRVISVLYINRLALLAQSFFLWLLLFSSCIYFLYTLNFTHIIIVIFLSFILFASFNYFSRSYGYQRVRTFLSDLIAATPSKKVADKILDSLITIGISIALGGFSLPLISEFSKIIAYINFIYFLMVVLASVVGKNLNPKYRPKIAIFLYWIFFIGIGGLTGLIAAAYKIPPIIDAFIISTFLALAIPLNSILHLKLKKAR